MMDDADDVPRIPPKDWLEALDRSEADLAAGRLVTGEAIMAKLRDTVAEMEAEHEQGKAVPGEAVPSR